MKTFNIILITSVSLIVLVFTALFLVGYFKPKPAGIKITTNPTSSVYIDGVFVGKSPYEGTHSPGQIILKLIPDSENQNLLPYETTLTLVSEIQTIIDREFGKTENESSGYVISFEKTGGTEASLVVITRPDSAQILIDGVSRGFAPYKVSAISPAMHKIAVRSPGFSDKEVTIKTIVGYKLVFFAKLSIGDSVEKQVAESSETKTTAKTFVQILDTPTGFLRVRSKPGSSGEEIAEVKPGDTYPFLGDDAETGWFLIQYQEPKSGLPSGITGWISGEYSQKVVTPP
jgi:hypothetical protein